MLLGHFFYCEIHQHPQLRLIPNSSNSLLTLWVGGRPNLPTHSNSMLEVGNKMYVCKSTYWALTWMFSPPPLVWPWSITCRTDQESSVTSVYCVCFRAFCPVSLLLWLLVWSHSFLFHAHWPWSLICFYHLKALLCKHSGIIDSRRTL